MRVQVCLLGDLVHHMVHMGPALDCADGVHKADLQKSGMSGSHGTGAKQHGLVSGMGVFSSGLACRQVST